MTTPNTIAEINARRQRYLDAHNHPNAFACCTAHASADDVPLLLERLSRLEAVIASAEDTPARIAAQVLDAEDRIRAELETLRAGAVERAALLDEARDALEAAGMNGAHGDDWPAIAPAIRALAAERDQARAQLAGVWPCVCSHLPDAHRYDSALGRNFCWNCKPDGDLHNYEPAPAKTED